MAQEAKFVAEELGKPSENEEWTAVLVMESVMHQGHCECGAVAFEVKNLRAEITMCHCSQCRRLSGHHWAATRAMLLVWILVVVAVMRRAAARAVGLVAGTVVGGRGW